MLKILYLGAAQRFRRPMRMFGGGLFLLAILGSPASAVSSNATCQTCDRQVSLTAQEAKCLSRRLDEYLKSSRDPIFVSVANCSDTKDGARQDPPPTLKIPRRKGKAEGPRKTTYKLSRADAVCLVGKLKVRPPKANVFDLDFSTC